MKNKNPLAEHYKSSSLPAWLKVFAAKISRKRRKNKLDISHLHKKAGG